MLEGVLENLLFFDPYLICTSAGDGAAAGCVAEDVHSCWRRRFM